MAGCKICTQTFTGAPKFGANEQYVLFLWVGRSGVPQIIGLSQGVFDISLSSTGTPLVRREPTTEMMVDSKGKQIRDEGVSMTCRRCAAGRSSVNGERSEIMRLTRKLARNCT